MYSGACYKPVMMGNSMATISDISASEVLTRHLENFSSFQTDEKAALDEALSLPVRSVNVRRDLIREGEAPRGVLLIVSGWACRYKMLEDGRRQIVSFLVPGDMCDLHNAVLARMDHSIGAITAVRYVSVSNDALHQLSTDHPRVGEALWWQMLVNVATQREWTINIGQRSAEERIGSLFCELMLRLRAVGLASKTSFDLPLTQNDIAEATGLTSVHVNRMMQQLRASGLISLTGKVMTIPDFSKLKVASLFAADYLHLDEERERTGGGK